MCDAPDTLRSVPDWTPLERLQHLRRIAREHEQALCDGSFDNCELVGFFSNLVDEADRILARLRGEE